MITSENSATSERCAHSPGSFPERSLEKLYIAQPKGPLSFHDNVQLQQVRTLPFFQIERDFIGGPIRCSTDIVLKAS
jgi:hypothetical protein